MLDIFIRIISIILIRGTILLQSVISGIPWVIIKCHYFYPVEYLSDIFLDSNSLLEFARPRVLNGNSKALMLHRKEMHHNVVATKIRVPSM